MGSTHKTDTTDSISTFLTEWQQQRPDLDPWPLAIIGRVARISLHLQRQAQGWLEPLGLTWESFSLIAALRRAGPPYEQRPLDLLRLTLLTSGAMTNRIDRVQSNGWVQRLPDPNDRRGVIVKLTPSGLELADKAIARHFEAAAELLDFLKVSEREQLQSLLSSLLIRLEAVDQTSEKAGSKF